MYIMSIIYIIKIRTVIEPILYALKDHPYCSDVNIYMILSGEKERKKERKKERHLRQWKNEK